MEDLLIPFIGHYNTYIAGQRSRKQHHHKNKKRLLKGGLALRHEIYALPVTVSPDFTMKLSVEVKQQQQQQTPYFFVNINK